MDIDKFNTQNPFTSLTQKQKDDKLINAAQHGSTEETILLIQAHANLNSIDDVGNTALMRAARNGHADIVRLLIQAKADLDISDYLGYTALMRASRNGYTEIVRLLIQAKANLEAVDNIRQTALISATLKVKIDIVQLLVEAKANLNSVNMSRRTALMLAAYYGHTEIARLLIEGKANIELSNNRGDTALSLSISRNHLDIAHLLFRTMTFEQVQKHINLNPNIDILSAFNHFKEVVIDHRVQAFKALGPLVLDINDNNPFLALPSDIMSIIGSNYCALEEKIRHPLYYAGLDSQKVYDVITTNRHSPLIFSLASPDKRAKEELSEESDNEPEAKRRRKA